MDESFQFPIEKIYNDLIIRLFFIFVILSFLTLFGILLFFNVAPLDIITTYVIAVVVFVMVIVIIEVELKGHLDIRHVKSKKINASDSPARKLHHKDPLALSLICPFCNQYMEIRHAEDREFRSFSNIHRNCIHYRDIVMFKDGIMYGKFVNQKDIDSRNSTF